MKGEVPLPQHTRAEATVKGDHINDHMSIHTRERRYTCAYLILGISQRGRIPPDLLTGGD